jgi:U6 snRNA-associated Sm-like protein LSm4
MLVELKNGETFNGILDNCDNWMNLNLRDVTCTSRDGSKFWKMNEAYVRGYTVKYIRVLDEMIDKVKEEQKKSRSKVSKSKSHDYHQNKNYHHSQQVTNKKSFTNKSSSSNHRHT